MLRKTIGKRNLLGLALCLLFALSAHAQNTLSISAAGVVQAGVDTNGWRSFKLTLTQNVTSFSFVGAPCAINFGASPCFILPSQAQVTVIFTQDATGGRTVTFASSISNACTITTTANASTICQFTLDGTTSTWQGINTGGSGGTTPAAGNAGITTQQALLFSSFNRHVDWGCTWSSGTPATVTCADGPFTSAMTGWLGFATSAVQGNDQQFTLLCGSNSSDTPITFVSATQVTINCTGANSGTNPFIFGPDETGHATGCAAGTFTPATGTCDGISGLIKTAALSCAILHWPSASAIVKSNPFVNPPTTNCANPVSIQRTGVGIIGDNPGPSQLTFYPNFNWTTCNLGGSGAGCVAANGSSIAGGYMLENWALNSFGTPMNPAAAHNIIEFEANTFGQHVYCLGIGGANANLTGFHLGFVPFNGLDIQADGCGQTPMVAVTTNGWSTCDQCYFGDSTGGVLITGQFASTKTLYGPTFGNAHLVSATGGQFNSSQDFFLPSGSTGGAMVAAQGSNPTVILNNDSLLDTRPSGATLYCHSTTGRITLNGRNLIGGTGTSAQSYFTDVTGCALDDLGNTKWSQTLQGTYTGTTFSGIPGVTELQGSCTGTATSSVTLGLYGLGENSAATCTVTTTALGTVMTKPGNIGALIVSAGTGGSTAGSGAVTVLKNGAAFGTSVTCTVGTSTSCIDTTHGTTATFVAGDIISAQMVTGAAETLANVKVTLILQGTT